MDAKFVFLALLLWFSAGSLAVYFAGVADRSGKTGGEAPVGLLFMLGPIGLFLSLVVMGIVSLDNTNSGFLGFIYKLGRGNKQA